MSKAQVKKALGMLSAEELVAVVMELYESRKEAKEYLEYWLNPDADKELDKVSVLIGRQFHTPSGVARRSPSTTEINKLIKNFMTLCYDPEKVAELLIFAAEKMSDWVLERYRSSKYRSAMRKYLTEARLYIETHELQERYGLRLERLTEKVEAIERWQENNPPRRRGLRRWW